MSAERADVQQIKDRIDIVSVISHYVTLTKAGSNYKGRCPFHKDDTPSFWVSPEKGLWHCFGCGAGGDVIGFIMKIENIPFVEAAERLATEAGLSFAAHKGNGSHDELYEISIAVSRWFADNLTNSAAGRRGREYLIKRGYPEETWDRFGLGYAPPGWDHLRKRFAGKYGVKPLIDLGLLVSKDNGTTYDRFRDRVIFPILDLSGRPVAFGGRAFEGEPKYLNSPKTALFDKGNHLYGLSWARETMQKEGSAVLVEGYTDVISLHLAGITNAVGSMGTSLTQGQAHLFGRFVKEVVISYDRDTAGGMASLRGMQILRNHGLSVRVVRLPEGDDPDSLVRREGAERMHQLIDASAPFHIFYIESLKERYNTASIAGKEAALEDAKPFFQGIRSLPLRQEIATRLAELLDLPFDGLMQELMRGRRHKPKADTDQEEHHWGPQQVILSLLLRGDVTWERLAALVSPEDFAPRYRPIVEKIVQTRGQVDASSMTTFLDEDSAREVSYLTLSEPPWSDVEKALRDALERLVELPEIEKKLKDLRGKMEDAERSGDHRHRDELQGAISTLLAQRLSRRRRDGKKQAANQR
ncbi:MAG: DNA primase [Candidatus Bipolaricaulota bacterium]|nr:DNA primase [Candidatus Bipolaricaulota bacterium]